LHLKFQFDNLFVLFWIDQLAVLKEIHLVLYLFKSNECKIGNLGNDLRH